MSKFSVLVGTVALAIAATGLGGSVSAQPYGPGMTGGYGPGNGGYGPGYGMMGGGYGPGYGMMGGGYGPGNGMMGGYGPGYGMRGGYGPGMMGYGGGNGPGGMMGGYGGGYGPGMMYSGRYQGDMKLSTDQVKNYLEQMVRNPNLKVGDVKEKDADTIVAEIVTKQGNSLVQRLDFNRHNGFVQPEQ